jgi:two-component system osmolarity sensor histidine kinase EnvZ
MLFRWLKQFLPSGLYGRTLLILLVPVVTVQIVVSIVFIQRHFDRVTEQMTENVAFPLGHLIDQIEAAPDVDAARARALTLGASLDFGVHLPGEPVEPGRISYDLSGRSVIRTFDRVLPELASIDLTNLDFVRLAVDTRWGTAEIVFPRGRVSASNPHQLLVIMVFVGLLMTGISYLFLRNQLRPITRLARAADAYGRGHVLPYYPRGATEVRAAGQAFLDMRDRIEEARETRTLLLSGVSHDLRTPLTRMKLGLSLMEENEAAAGLKADVGEMERMVGDFLAFTRGEAAEESAPARPAEIAEQVALNTERMGRKLALTIEGARDAAIPMRFRAITRAVENLVQNALRHAGNVRLDLWIGERSVVFRVEDDGPGIPPERRAEALRPFTRLDEARTRGKGEGAGLGLAIAADAARAHGGDLRLGESKALGGLSAELVLPR